MSRIKTPKQIKDACHAYVSVVALRMLADADDVAAWRTIHQQLSAATRLAAKLAKQPAQKEGL